MARRPWVMLRAGRRVMAWLKRKEASVMSPSIAGEGMVGDPGIEPGMGLPGGVTVRCRTLQLVARREAGDSRGGRGRQGGKRREIPLASGAVRGTWMGDVAKGICG